MHTITNTVIRNDSYYYNLRIPHEHVSTYGTAVRFKLGDLPPEAPSFITRVCGFGFHILRCQFGQARRARSPRIAQALDARQRVFGCPEMSAV